MGKTLRNQNNLEEVALPFFIKVDSEDCSRVPFAPISMQMNRKETSTMNQQRLANPFL
jgi:hypothetical protein